MANTSSIKITFTLIIFSTIITIIILLCSSTVNAGLGSPKLSIETDVSPSTTLHWGETATLTVTVREVGGEDWAKDVIVTPIPPIGSNIVITPSVSKPKNINRNGFAVYKFKIYIPEHEEPGLKDITIKVEYGDTGWLDIGEWRHNITGHVQILVKKPLSTLIIKTIPSGARVYINDEYKGITPLTLTLKDGTYNLRLEKDGYEPIQELVTLYPGNTIRVVKELKPKIIPPPPIPQKVASNLETQNTISSYLLALFIIFIIIGVSMLNKNNKKSEPKDELKIKKKPERLKVQKTKKIYEFPVELKKKYKPLEFIGEGEFAKVFKAINSKNGKVVAIKIPKTSKTGKAFISEVSTWLHLTHPNIVKLYDADILPIPHLEMEFIEGAKINSELARDLEEYPKPVDEDVALKLIKGIAEGLKYAHSKGIYHRDLKPKNVLINSELTPKITDWGLAKISVANSMISGYTPLYAAPEQLKPSKYGSTDQRTDIWQLGVVFYELLTGKLPFEGYTQEEVSGKITDETYEFILPSKIKPELEKYDPIFNKILAKRKDERYQSVDEFLDDLIEIEKVKDKKLEKRVMELNKSLKKSIENLKKSKNREEIKQLTLSVVETLGELALIHAELNKKAELLNVLNDLKFYTKDNLDDLLNAIERVEFMIEENIPIGKEYIDKLKILISNIKRENKRN